jgi:hypothetical protein
MSDLGNAEMIACTGMNTMHWQVMPKRLPRFAKLNESRAHERARGVTAFRVEPGKPVERLEQFDPRASQIIMVPKVAGG